MVNRSANELKRLLQDGIRFAPHYLPSNNSDHLPMTLCAMAGLGATPGQLQAFRDDYSPRLHEWVSPSPLSDWRDGTGDFHAYPALLQFFLGEVAVRGRMATVQHYLPTFLPGIALHAFHPVIRLGYALDFQCDEEVAAGLAYMIAGYDGFDPAASWPTATSLESPIALSALLRDQVQQGQREFQSARFGKAVLELVAAGEYPQWSAAGTGRTGLEECARCALALYQGTRNFFALHLVTATQALGVITDNITSNSISSKPAAGDDLWALAAASMGSAILAAHLVLGSPRFDTPPLPPDELDAEHSLKYVWACQSEYRALGQSVYLDEIRAFRDAGLVPAWVAPEVS